MRIRLIIPFSLLAAAIIFSILTISGCGNLDIQGPQLENSPPWVKWAITPSDSMVHSFNPALRWFGGDTNGLIADFQYGVFQAAYLDSASRETSLDIPDTLTWISLGNVTRATIPLVASPDSSVSVGQYVVLRAIDDEGDTSNVINRYLMRTNNRPTCIVTVPEDPEWVLPDTTSTWNGIPITWEGGDSLDYPGAQPDFLWEVKIFGPYETRNSAELDSADFNPDTAPLYDQLTDNDEDSLRIVATGHSFTNLLTGYYIIYVRNYDDANVPSVPALGIFEVYEPHWIRHPDETMDILLLNSTFYSPLVGNLPSDWSDSVHQFYANVIDDAGIAPDKWTWINVVPNIRTLYLYRLVIIDDLDWNQDINQTTQEAFVDYLDVGGMIWVIGRMSFSNTAGFTGLYQYQGNAVEPLPFTFLGLAGAYFSSITDTPEFIGANKYDNVSAAFPDISIDPLKVQALNGDFDYAIPQVEFLILAPGTESIYKFNAINPSVSGTFHNFPVAVRRETATLKTSYFSFPLFMMDYDEAAQIFDTMLTWFLSE